MIFSSGTQNGGGLTIAPWNTNNGGIRINGSGNVGIGITNPSYNLHVIGNAGLSTGTAWTNASDIRLKDIDGDYEHGLDAIKKLHAVRYHYKRGNALRLPYNHAMTGFIAQEVQEVIPEAVKMREDGYLELNVDPIHWATVNAVKELAAENEDFKRRADRAEAQAAKMKAEAIDLRKRVGQAEYRAIRAEERAGQAEAEISEIKQAICRKMPEFSFCNPTLP